MILRAICMIISSFAAALMSAEEEGDRTIPVGGQAVIEGVLMRGPDHWGLVVREPGGAMWRKAWLGATWLKHGLWTLPIVRGFANMVEMMRVGMRALSLSAERALGEDDEFSWGEVIISGAVAIALVIGLFIALPVYLADRSVDVLGASSLAHSIIEGIVRGAVFIGYVALVGLMPDIKRVFAYHGAEHKTINAFESRAPLTPESVARCSRIHRRCGTSFIVIVVVVSIAVFSLLRAESFAARAALRVALLPVVVGISYEFIKAASRSQTWGRVMIKPALLLQHITTREPDMSMIEVALRSLDVALDPYASLSGARDGADSFERITEEEEGIPHGSVGKA